MTAIVTPIPVFDPPLSRDDEPLYEIIDGQKVELPPMSALSAFISFQLMSHVNFFVLGHDLGRSGTELLFRLPPPLERNRRPDGGFVSYQRWPKNRPMPASENAWDVVPELAVEVVSPTDFVEELLEKIEEYFRVGVQLVWVVYPRLRVIHVYDSYTKIRVLARTDTLDGGSVLPGFTLPLVKLFPEENLPQ